MMIKRIVLAMIFYCSLPVIVFAQEGDDKVKSLSGISIVGNKEAPKSLYIVPWRSSDIGMETDLNSSLLNEGLHAVDKEVFQRELNFYEVSNTN